MVKNKDATKPIMRELCALGYTGDFYALDSMAAFLRGKTAAQHVSMQFKTEQKKRRKLNGEVVGKGLMEVLPFPEEGEEVEKGLLEVFPFEEGEEVERAPAAASSSKAAPPKAKTAAASSSPKNLSEEQHLPGAGVLILHYGEMGWTGAAEAGTGEKVTRSTKGKTDKTVFWDGSGLTRIFPDGFFRAVLLHQNASCKNGAHQHLHFKYVHACVQEQCMFVYVHVYNYNRKCSEISRQCSGRVLDQTSVLVPGFASRGDVVVQRGKFWTRHAHLRRFG